MNVKERYVSLQNKFSSLALKKYFDEIYIGIIALITLIGWKFSNEVGMALLIVSASVVLLLSKNFKYMLPQIIYFIFCISNDFFNGNVPISIIIFGSLFIQLICYSAFKNGFSLKKMKSFYGLLGLAIMNLVPILWCRNVPAGNEIFYIFFIADAAYLALYIIVCNGVKDNSIMFLCKTLSFLGVLLAMECLFCVLQYKDSVESIFDLWYYLGWGLCNEAGIMLCFSIPFTFYLAAKGKTYKDILYQLGKIGISLVGIILTTSRGTYGIGIGMIAVLLILLWFIADEKKKYRRIFLISLGVAVVGCLICIKPISDVVVKGFNKVFADGIDGNGRDKLWTIGINKWTENGLTVIFGPGILCDIAEHEFTTDAIGRVQALSPTVFHSTIIQTLCMGGVVGLLLLCFHGFEKYRNLFKANRCFAIIMCIGFALVDFYGFVDNTYHMYYYMMPLATVLAVIDASNFHDLKEKSLFEKNNEQQTLNCSQE